MTQGASFVKETQSHETVGLWAYLGSQSASVPDEVNNFIQNFTEDKFTVLFAELEQVAPLIYSYGEELAVHCLTAIGSILREAWPNSLIQKLGFDKFIIVMPCNDSQQKLSKEIADVLKKVKEYGIRVKKTPVYLQLKFGASEFINNSDNSITEALDRAYIALHEIRNVEGSNFSVFSAESEKLKDFKSQVQLASFFLSAIENNQLRLAFQPLVKASTGEITSYEALLRIVTEDSQIISAGPFIPVAENFGFIDIIDKYVLKLVVRELGLDPSVRIAMNVSNLTVSNHEWMELATELLKDEKIASRLTVELTETGLEKSLNKIDTFVERLQSYGVRIAIDDFGAGYTSFKQLKMISADVLKIDGIFVKDIAENHDSRLFVKTLLEFSRAYNLKTVAEFVETGEIAKILMDLGVDYLQGFYFGHAYNFRPWINDDRIV